MTPPTHLARLMTGLGLALAAVQLLDIGLHVATGQAEAVRIAANLNILLWLAALAAGRIRFRFNQQAGLALAVYLFLNGLFLARAGLTNPAQGDAPRVTLFALIGLTVVLAGALTYVHSQRQST